MLESRKLRVTGVGLGRRWISTDLSNEHLERCLKNGRNLRKSNAYPIKCRVTLQSGEGRGLHPYRHFEFARIPPGGITKEGYVKEAWIKCYSDLRKIDNLSYEEVIDPHVHRKLILNFTVEQHGMTLLPSQRIVVKYYKKKDTGST